MSEFDAAKSATALRESARSEMHGINHESPLLSEFRNIPPGHAALNAVGAELEKTNAIWGLSSAPQASVRRDDANNVVSIEFSPGKLDDNSYDPRVVSLARF